MNFNWRKNQKNKSKRFIEIDAFRGIALLLMIFGHVLWDLDYFGVIPINNGVYSTLQKIVPQMFFFIVGIGLIVSRKKKVLSLQDEKKYYKHLAFRGLKIFGLGMLLTVFSLIFIPETPVFFGVLHCIGLSIIISIPFLMFRKLNFIFALLLILVGMLFSNIVVENATIFHLIIGLQPENVWMFTVDYFPLLPWFGVILLGMSIGDVLYCGDKRRFRIPDLSRYKPAKFCSWFGQHSLEIYLLHQPVIAGFMYLFIRTF